MVVTGTQGADKVYTHTITVHGANSAEVALVPKDKIPLIWQKILPLVEKKCWFLMEKMDSSELLTHLYLGNADLWVGITDDELDGFAICQWEIYTHKKYYRIVALAGEKLQKYLSKGMQLIEDYAAIRGAEEVVLEGRKAWVRLLAKRGYGSRTVLLRKPVQVRWRH